MLRKIDTEGQRKSPSRFPYVKISTVLLVIIGILLQMGTATPLLAAQCDPASDCSNCLSNEERLKCKFDALANESDTMISRLEESPTLSETQREGLRKAKERLKREKSRVKPDDFHVMTKKKGASCQLVEIDNDGVGNDDGECDTKSNPRENCAEVLNDGIGNDDGICEPMTGKAREVCVQLCDEESLLQSEIDEDLVNEVESTYEIMTGHLKEVNNNLAAAAMQVDSLGLSYDPGDPCAFDPALYRTSDESYKKAKWAAVGGRAGTDLMERFCDQTFTSVFFTWTLGVVCVAAETGVLVANEFLNAMDTTDSELDAQVLDATFACAKQAMDSTGANQDQIDAVQSRANKVKANQAMILQLIKSPPGQRPGYPKP